MRHTNESCPIRKVLLISVLFIKNTCHRVNVFHVNRGSKSISKMLGEKETTVGPIIETWNKSKIIVNRPHSGAPINYFTSWGEKSGGSVPELQKRGLVMISRMLGCQSLRKPLVTHFAVKN